MASTFFLASAIGAALGVIIAAFGAYTYLLYRLRGFAREIALLARQHETIGFYQAHIDAIEKGVTDDAVALPESTLRVSILFHRHQHQLRARCGCSLCAAIVKDYEAA